MKDFVYVVTKI